MGKSTVILGVTGSRDNRPDRLILKLMKFFSENDVSELHHGDCTGWNYQAFLVADDFGVKTVSHPPCKDAFRANTNSNVIMPEKPYLNRNKDIVNASTYLIAAPDGPERKRSGTWSTVRYAKRVGVAGVVWM